MYSDDPSLYRFPIRVGFYDIKLRKDLYWKSYYLYNLLFTNQTNCDIIRLAFICMESDYAR